MSETYPASVTVAKPSNFLVLAIVSMVIGFLPLGIVSTIYATRVDTLWFEGRHQEALSSSQSARNWAIASFVCVAVFMVGVLLFGLLIFGATLHTFERVSSQ